MGNTAKFYSVMASQVQTSTGSVLETEAPTPVMPMARPMPALVTSDQATAADFVMFPVGEDVPIDSNVVLYTSLPSEIAGPMRE